LSHATTTRVRNLLGYPGAIVADLLMQLFGVGAVVLVISLLFTHLQVANIWVTISVLLLTAIVFALAGMANAIFARKFDDIAIIPTFVLGPLTYLGGVFYSVNMLPGWAHTLSHSNPILYMVSAFRYGFLGTSDVSIVFAFAMMPSRMTSAWTWSRIAARGSTTSSCAAGAGSSAAALTKCSPAKASWWPTSSNSAITCRPS
jgi:ABC-type polysaccharide/polyol phosphate export permease